MSDALQHECGIALVRLLKPLEFYKEKYGTVLRNTEDVFTTTEDKMVLVLQV
jgi:amidophosphoribosyltransferase